jgi:DNA-binding response OmpR family regulator
VLLVEDNRDDAYMISRVLTAAPARFEVVHVDRLSLAVEHAEEGRFDIVLLDLGLPEGIICSKASTRRVSSCARWITRSSGTA